MNSEYPSGKQRQRLLMQPFLTSFQTSFCAHPYFLIKPKFTGEKKKLV